MSESDLLSSDSSGVKPSFDGISVSVITQDEYASPIDGPPRSSSIDTENSASQNQLEREGLNDGESAQNPNAQSISIEEDAKNEKNRSKAKIHGPVSSITKSKPVRRSRRVGIPLKPYVPNTPNYKKK